MLSFFPYFTPGFDIAKIAENFVRDPNAPEFTALHRVGEQYDARNIGPNKLPLPDFMRKADTLKTLAQVYRRPLLEFQQLNREQQWASDQWLPPETLVNVPDPDFAPLLAAYLAAEALTTSSLSAATQAQLIQSLVPIASSNPTALDTVLARLLLAAKPRDPSMLKRLAQTAAQYAVAEKPSDALSW